MAFAKGDFCFADAEPDLCYTAIMIEPVLSEPQSSWDKLYQSIRFPYRENSLIGVTFFIVLFLPLVFSPWMADSLELPKLAILLISLAAGIFILTTSGKTIRYNKRLYIIFGLFILQALLSTIFSWDIGTSLFGLSTRWTSSLLFYSAWIAAIIIFIQAIETDAQYWFLIKTGIVTVLAINLFAIAQSFGFAYYPGLDPTIRSLVPSFLGNPNFSAMYVAALLPLAVVAYARATTATTRVYYIAVLASSIVALGLFNSRGAIIAGAVSGGILTLGGLIYRSHRRVAVAAMITTVFLLVVSGALLLASRPQIVQNTVALTGADASQRILVWQRSLEFVHAHPMFGVGPGNFYLAYQKYLNLAIPNFENFDDAHNIFLHLAVNVGLPMLVLYLILIVLGLWWGWRLWKSTNNPVYLALFASVISWQISASFNPVVIPCWILLALLLVGIYRHNVPLTLFLPRFVRYVFRVKAVFLIVIVLAFGLNDYLTLAAGNYYYAKQYDQSIRYGRIATALDPFNHGVMRYWIGSRIMLKQDPSKTNRLVSWFYWLHPMSSRPVWSASILEYRLYRQTNDPQYLHLAYDYVDRSLALTPDYGPLCFYAAYIHYQTKDNATAISYIERAIKIAPNELIYWSLLAKIDQQTGNRDGTIRALERAAAIQRDSRAYKQVLKNAKSEADVQKIQIPINFSEPDI